MWAASYLYVIGPKVGPVKIGISAEPFVRLSQLQGGHPKKLSVIAKMPGGRDEEEQVHRFLGIHRLEGEWFRRSAEVKDFMGLISSGLTVPLALAGSRQRETRFFWSGPPKCAASPSPLNAKTETAPNPAKDGAASKPEKAFQFL